jgi:translation elongation factor EF-Tu-like GTPase
MPMPTETDDEPFMMVIDDFFDLKKHGISVAGHIKSGKLRTGDTVQLSGTGKATIVATVAGIELI